MSFDVNFQSDSFEVGHSLVDFVCTLVLFGETELVEIIDFV